MPPLPALASVITDKVEDPNTESGEPARGGFADKLAKATRPEPRTMLAPHTALIVNGNVPLLVHDWDTALYVLAVPCTLLPNGRLCQLAGCVFQLKLQPPHCGYWQLGQ